MNQFRHFIAWLIAVGAVLFQPNLQATEPTLKAFTAKYQVSRSGLTIGNVEISLKIKPSGKYAYRGYTTSTGLLAVFRQDEIIEQSYGTIRNRQVTPVSYSYQHIKKEETRAVDLSFDWQSFQVTNQANNSHWSMKIPHGTQDKFSQQLALMLELAQGKKQIHFKVADGGRLKDYQFNLRQAQTLDLPIGQHRGLKLELSKDNRPSKLSLWLAPELNFLPVKIERHKKNGLFIMELVELEWGNKPTP